MSAKTKAPALFADGELAPDWKAPDTGNPVSAPRPAARNPAPVTDLDGWDMVPE